MNGNINVTFSPVTLLSDVTTFRDVTPKLVKKIQLDTKFRENVNLRNCHQNMFKTRRIKLLRDISNLRNNSNVC